MFLDKPREKIRAARSLRMGSQSSDKMSIRFGGNHGKSIVSVYSCNPCIVYCRLPVDMYCPVFKLFNLREPETECGL